MAFVKYVIIGNGVAGTTAALHIRKLDSSSEIWIISEETYPFYSRIRLIDFIADEASEKDITIFKDEWYEKNRITLILNTHATGIDPASKTITLSSSQKISYDKLLIATGSSPFIPSIKGSNKKGVFTLRTLSDAKRIKDYSTNIYDVIVLGGGVLGMEVGNALRKTGKIVSIVEFAPRLLPRQMDAEGSEILKKKLQDMGFKFFLDAKAKEITGEDMAEGLLLEDGRHIKGNMIVISAGIRPDASLLHDIGIKTANGVPVNDRMETEIPDIYAAGDLIEHRGIFYGIWQAAEKQGEVAGIDMAGGSAAYTGTLPSNILKVADIDLLSAGEIDVDCKLEFVVTKDETNGIYKKLVFQDGCIVGCILCGDTKAKKQVLNAIQEKKNKSELDSLMNELSLK
ncbi:MAG: NAD(P)/FAD-dependent oxidoreductase [Thermodesulfovibrio sp.]|nr:NAD(P)/FAD-dependent oxidoreductase [Thermodesulfovibrio sp.]